MKFKQNYIHIFIVGLLLAPITQYAQDDEFVELTPFISSGNTAPRSVNETILPASVLTGSALQDSLNTTLGETLTSIPGVHSNSFAGGASRPVIRGFDGPRIRIMENGLEIMDVSNTSPDHAVAIEPFFVRSIEVIRSPASLLYGSSAIGGTVNVIDRRTNTLQLSPGLSGDFIYEFDSASEGSTAGALFTHTKGDWSITVSALLRDHQDYDIPGFAESDLFREREEEEEHGHDDDDDHDEEEEHEEEHEDEHGHEDEEEIEGTLENSFFESQAYSVSTTRFYGNNSRVSLTLNQFDSLYGLSGHSHEHGHEEDEHGHEDEDEDEDHDEEHEEHDEHEDEHGHEDEEESVSIDLKSIRVALDWLHVLDQPILQSIETRFAFTDYQHTEFEGEETGTYFGNEAWELRSEANYILSDINPGLAGIQLNSSDFVAIGEEAFTPPSETEDLAGFILQEWNVGDTRYEAGARLERRIIETDVAANYQDIAASFSGGVYHKINDRFAVALSGNRSQRHPIATELYANGAHIATSQFEIGDPSLELESAMGIDATLFWEEELFSGNITVFATNYDDYIYLNPTGEIEDDLPVFQFTAEDAEFRGVEAEFTWHAVHTEEYQLHVSALYDYIDTELTTTSDNLPRVPPQRVGLSVDYDSNNWNFGTRLIHAFEQDETAFEELPTDAYTDISAFASYNVEWQGAEWSFMFKVRNALDEEIRHHTSSTKDVAPRPGRSFVFSLGIRI